MSAVPVVIVQDKKSASELFSLLFTSLFTFALNTWVIMLLLGVLTDWGVSYGYTAAAIMVIKGSTHNGSTNWLTYTRAAK